MSDTTAKILASFEALRSELADLGSDWTECPESDFFCTLDWFENLTRHGFEGRDLTNQIQLFFCVNKPLGRALCLPLISGNPVTSLANYYSSLFGPLKWNQLGVDLSLDSEASFCSDAAWHCAAMLRDYLLRYPEMRLQPMDIQSDFATQLTSALKSTGFWTDFYFCFGNWYLDVANRSFALYSESLPSSLINNIARGHRRLGQQGIWCIDIQQAGGQMLESSIADFVSVYNQSWKVPEPNSQFIPSFARMAFANGWLRLGILKLNDQPIAAQLWLTQNGKAFIFKLAYTKGFERFSAGSVLTHAMMRHVIDVDRVREVDYLTGDDAYKKDWMSHRRERWGIVAFRHGTIRGSWKALRHVFGKLMKLWRQS